MTKVNSKIKAQIELLKNGSDEAVISEIKTLRKLGSTALVPVLIERWNNSTNETLNNNIFKLMIDIRPQDALEDIIQAIKNPAYSERKNLLISILWQSSLDASEYLVDLLTVALEGDYITILEVSTVIESFDTVFNEQDIMEAIYQIDERIEEESDEENRNMLNSLKQVISKLPIDQ